MIKGRFVIGCASCFAGCTSLSPQPAFRDIQAAVGERIDQRVEWRQVSEADAAVDAEIDVLLHETLSADEAAQIALLNHRNLQALYEELGIAQADLVEAGLLENPIFEAQYRIPGRPANPWEIHVVHDFIDVFFIPLRRRAASAALEAAKFRIANTVFEHAAETRRAFYRMQAAEQLTELRTNVVAVTEASALLAERQQQAGNISDLDLANEQALHEQSKVDLALAEVEALEQRERLNELMGLRGSEAAVWRIEPRLSEPLPDGVAADELESLAVSRRLDLLAVRQEIESLGQSLNLTRASAWVPSLEIGGHVEREPDGPATWGPSVGLPLPLFSQGQPAIARTMSKFRQKQQEYLALGVKVQSEVRSATNRMAVSRKVAESYKSVMLPLRGKIVEESQLHYNAMQIGPFQLLQAKQAELEAGSRYIEALKNYWIALADLERAVGGRLDLMHPEKLGVRESVAPPANKETTSHGGHQ